ncbi:imidazole glycerol phosphate synthase subunit HisF [Calothrix sp. FACHB-1219]|uniref:glycosyl amidation-associated protein WbuZ n=1 Tax=unclassified Calothrix TaxID=2619626 RepID=UPI0016886751|nr:MULTISPECIES: glycosyl amidation-associated protein WbuZ [unclassified Calothrix]MBD2201234.1 imidazole glycerol phosphate synthase subunit HisF [Calothrix sp. FACHB-168]MBD2215668.1 imidazole glycerol phosphate synthase subunit HisF [Calothrix sp. FACHB-1219]
MLKVRVMPTLLFKNFGLVKGIQFNSWRRVGSAMQAVKVYNMREVDELIFLDITASNEGRSPDFETVDELADECYMPLTVGGGVQTIADVKRLLLVGADKVAINTAAVLTPELIRATAQQFGSQCVVVSIDAKKLHTGQYEVFTHGGTKATGKDPVKLAQEVEKLGAGEILLTSIDADGTMKGYDIELTRKVTLAVSIPVIASGGAGKYEHMASALIEGGASAIAAASMFHFTEQTPLQAKRFLKERGINVRQ